MIVTAVGQRGFRAGCDGWRPEKTNSGPAALPTGGPDMAQLYFGQNANLNYPPDPDRNRAKTVDVRRNMAVRTLPREGATKIKIKSVLKYSWDG